MSEFSGNAKAERDLDDAIERVYAKYGNDLPAFFRDLKSKREATSASQNERTCENSESSSL